MDKESIDDKEIAEITIMLEFIKNIKDLLHALNDTFNDKVNEIIINDKVYSYFFNYDQDINIESFQDNDFFNNSTQLFEYCVGIFPNKFFDILYENEEIFNEPLYLLPNINFSDLYFDTTSSSTKETLWKYIQLILFTIITSIKDKHSFGDTEKLFEAINPNELKNKLESTLNNIHNLFNNPDENNDISNNDFDLSNNFSNFSNLFNNIDLSNIDLSNIDLSNNNMNNIFSNILNNLDLSNLDISNLDISNLDISNLDISNLDISNLFNAFKNNYKNKNFNDNSSNKFNNLPDFNNIHDHINNLVNGKIGNLAKELAEETANDMDIDFENVNNMDEVFKKLFKSPDKLMGLVNNIGKKIDNKMKDGSIKESELLEEATDLLKNMTNMPGMNNFTDLFKSMNLDKMMPKNGKINKNAFENMMNQNVKMSKMKERMKEKLEKNKEYSKNYEEKDSLQNINKNLEQLQSEMLQNNDYLNHIIQQENSEKKNTNKPKKNNKNNKNNKKKR